MNDKEALLAARRKIDDTLDALDNCDDHLLPVLTAAILLTIARVALNTALSRIESEGQKESAPAPDEA